MNRLRLWILVTAVGCFTSGLVVGYLTPSVLAGIDHEARQPDPEEYFIEQMVRDYDLSADQQRVLRMVLRARQEEEMALIRRFELEQLPAALRAQIKNVRNRAEQRIRRLLTAEQRRLYDQMTSLGDK